MIAVVVVLFDLHLLLVLSVGSCCRRVWSGLSYNCRPFRRFSFLAAKILFGLCASFGLEGCAVAAAGP